MKVNYDSGKSPYPISFKKNASWLVSAKIGFMAGVVWAPTSMLELLKLPVMSLFMSAFLIVIALLLFISRVFVYTITGLCGFASDPDDDDLPNSTTQMPPDITV